jgi:protease PrsW
MTILAQTAGGGEALATAVVLAVVYLLLVRFIDLNEKEPFWTIGLVFFVGFMFSMVLHLLAPTLELNLVGGPVLIEGVKWLAVAASVALLVTISNWRGWSEFNGVLDGVVYGAAVGLGFATGEVFVRELLLGEVLARLPGVEVSRFGQLWTLALTGLAEGLFGAISGAFFGLAAMAARGGRRVALPLLGAVVAIVLRVLYEALARGGSFGSAGQVRTYLALAIPVVFFIGAILWALRQEKAIITRELIDEAESGTVTPEELRLLRSFGARRAAYLKRLFSGDIDGWVDLKALHNRQVELAFAEDQLRRANDPQDRRRREHEVAMLRAAVMAARGELDDEGRPLASAGTEATQ